MVTIKRFVKPGSCPKPTLEPYFVAETNSLEEGLDEVWNDICGQGSRGTKFIVYEFQNKDKQGECITIVAWGQPHQIIKGLERVYD